MKGNAPKGRDQLFPYVGRNWIYSKRWSPESWSYFYVAIRTNNNPEGLHRVWNEAAGRKLKKRFYRLAEFLRHISSVVTLEIRLNHDKIKHHVRKSSRIKDRILFDNWDEYLRNELDLLQLLDKIVADVASILPLKNFPFH